MIRGVPFGVHIAWLSINKTGIPFDITRVAPLTHCAVTQGMGLPAGVVNGQPATVCGEGCITIGWPLTVTRGLVTVGWACPACAHRTVAPR